MSPSEAGGDCFDTDLSVVLIEMPSSYHGNDLICTTKAVRSLSASLPFKGQVTEQTTVNNLLPRDFEATSREFNGCLKLKVALR